MLVLREMPACLLSGRAGRIAPAAIYFKLKISRLEYPVNAGMMMSTGLPPGVQSGEAMRHQEKKESGKWS
ncbi:MAG: hypothetical protein AAGL24_12730 [Pseudomonadota bacterium]